MNNWQAKKADEVGRGGDAGEIFIAARKIMGDGAITADGGNGSIGGKGGKVTIITEDNQFAGRVSAQGGKSFNQPGKWWEANWFQVIALLGAIAGIIALAYLFI